MLIQHVKCQIKSLQIWLATSSILLAASACTPSGEVVSTSFCNESVARANYVWQVEYFTDPGVARDLRREEFANNELINRNGEKPADAVTGPDDNGVWWAALPPRPTPDEVDARRKTGERNNPPALQRQVKYILQCDAGELLTDGQTYRQTSKALRSGEKVHVSYSLGRVLKADIPSASGSSTQN